jgi:hypothetical protein
MIPFLYPLSRGACCLFGTVYNLHYRSKQSSVLQCEQNILFVCWQNLLICQKSSFFQLCRRIRSSQLLVVTVSWSKKGKINFSKILFFGGPFRCSIVPVLDYRPFYSFTIRIKYLFMGQSVLGFRRKTFLNINKCIVLCICIGKLQITRNITLTSMPTLPPQKFRTTKPVFQRVKMESCKS